MNDDFFNPKVEDNAQSVQAAVEANEYAAPVAEVAQTPAPDAKDAPEAVPHAA